MTTAAALHPAQRRILAVALLPVLVLAARSRTTPLTQGRPASTPAGD